MGTRKTSLAVVLGCLLGSVSPVVAHPDYTMTCRLQFNFENGAIGSITQYWAFDARLSQEFLDEFDGDRDGAFNASESGALEREVMASLAEVRYLTFVRVGDNDVGVLSPYDFQATVHDGSSTSRSRCACHTRQTRKTDTIKVQVKDVDLLIGVLYAETDPVLLLGADGWTCSYTIAENAADAYYGGTVLPEEITLACRR
ncbi:MAG: DUF1007 family protein [Alphaproteobacteria bacterium]